MAADKFCYSKGPAGDYGFRMVSSDYTAQAGEELFDHAPTDAELGAVFSDYSTVKSAQSTKQQIALLESRMTFRRLREAVLGTDNGWLKNLDSQIASLRDQL